MKVKSKLVFLSFGLFVALMFGHSLNAHADPTTLLRSGQEVGIPRGQGTHVVGQVAFIQGKEVTVEWEENGKSHYGVAALSALITDLDQINTIKKKNVSISRKQLKRNRKELSDILDFLGPDAPSAGSAL